MLVTAFCLFTFARAQVPCYLFALNTTGGSGSSGSATYTYSVGETVTFNNSCAYTPGLIQPSCLTIVAVEEIVDQHYIFKCYPNPTSSQVTIETNYADFTNYSITSVEGKIFVKGRFDYSPIDFSKLTAGTYYLKLTDMTNQIFKTFLIIKQ